LLTEPASCHGHAGSVARRSSRAAKPEIEPVAGVPRDGASNKNWCGLKALGAWGTAKRILN